MQITRLAGIPLRIHWSFVALVGVYVAVMAITGGLASVTTAAVVIALLFTSVVLHELGHALMARVFGIDTAHITLYPFGGVAAITRMPARPLHELLIALAGPAVNVVLAVPFAWGWLLTGHQVLGLGFVLNVLMAVFNMLPAFPMDGGRVLRALLTTRMGFLPATRVALRLGRVFAWAFLGLGLVLFNLSLVLVALFLHFVLSAESRQLQWLTRQAALHEAARRGAWWDHVQPARPAEVPAGWRQARAVRSGYVPRWRLAPAAGPAPRWQPLREREILGG